MFIHGFFIQYTTNQKHFSALHAALFFDYTLKSILTFGRIDPLLISEQVKLLILYKVQKQRKKCIYLQNIFKPYAE